MKTCPKCGYVTTNDNARFCHRCGENLTEKEVVEKKAEDAGQTFSYVTDGQGEEILAVEPPIPTEAPYLKPRRRKRFPFFMLLIPLAVALFVATIFVMNRKKEEPTQATEDSLTNTIIDNMVRVEGGTYTMGATAEQGAEANSDEKPAHAVKISSFWICRYEVTQAEWEAVMGRNPSRFKGEKRPVENVSWNQCQQFVLKLNQRSNKTFRMPTEAEWEYAARGGKKTKAFKYAGSNDISQVAWDRNQCYYKTESNPNYGTHNVGTKMPNGLGIYDMSGNVFEWCSDWYASQSYSIGTKRDPKGINSGNFKVNRGGSWYKFPKSCRVSCRNCDRPEYRSHNLGLRLVMSEEQNSSSTEIKH